MQIRAWFVLICDTLIITNVVKRLYLPYIFYNNFSVNFLESTWICTHKKSSKPRFLRWHHLSIDHHPVNITISKDRLCWTVRAKCSHNDLIQWIHLQTKGGKVTLLHSNIYWNYNVYWMVIGKWSNLKNHGLEDFLWAYLNILWTKKLTDKLL